VRRFFAIIPVLVSLAACGDDDGGSTPPDAAVTDAAQADAAPPVTNWFVFDSIAVPTTFEEEDLPGFDLDGDGTRDNVIGALFAAIESQSAYSLRTRMQAAVNDGRLIYLEGISTGQADEVSVVVLRGADLDDDVDDNFSGLEPFRIDPVEGESALLGSLRDGRLTAGPGSPIVQLAFDRDAPTLALPAVSGRVRCTVAERLRAGMLGGGITMEIMANVVVPAFAAGVQTAVDRDCDGEPPFPCPPDSEGEAILTFFDDNEDGMVTAAELMANNLVGSTVRTPDLDLLDADGNPSEAGDGVNDSLSFGLGFTAVPAVVDE
jgi:hypothetical protein